MLDPELKTKWVAALRSGEYTQGTGRMAITYEGKLASNCCLGVLAEVFGLERREGGSYLDEEFNTTHTCWFSDKRERALGFEDEVGTTNPIERPTQSRLMHLNDAGRSFAEIADVIEKEY